MIKKKKILAIQIRASEALRFPLEDTKQMDEKKNPNVGYCQYHNATIQLNG